ncbi:DUF2141 domain-containing protein [Microvirga sp. 3-52]|jgi:uncharacterized protein (DUF2141 family)|uniref:DUF2141 domain-containing protein n=1 Tax=Microvirga sp. 3-52 TaxID=2792425 RepID=UPI001AD08E9C|nr:DUF2141 domain-containing protein [Microvirga sp. 3-52]MBO1905979.1 DUF2141 domain-containing protein [Microvirga sp. 3-52]MBS7452185.1 DUF2141 domain-containing protein [Microvirga sp. 3-52]
MRPVGLAVVLFLSVSSTQAATLTIRAQGVQADRNMVYAGICDTSFDEATCPYKDRGQATAGTVELRIRNVKPGTYAIAVFHDVNGNGKLDRSFIGLPNEPYGFSNDVGRRGPPNFEAARILVKEPTTTVVIPIR